MRSIFALAAIGGLIAVPGYAEDIRVAMAGGAYGPAVIEARIGDILVFVNDDDDIHNVLIPTLGFATDLGKQDPLAETRLPLGRVGLFDVECVVHAGMHARVAVRP